MYQDLDEPIDVIVLYDTGTLRPLRFRWNGRSFKIARVTGTWKAPQGDTWMRHFSVVDTRGNVFFLAYDERRTRWTISRLGWSSGVRSRPR
jgi:hypothetical protein